MWKRGGFGINRAASTAQVTRRIPFKAKNYPSNGAVIGNNYKHDGGSSATIIKAKHQITFWFVSGLMLHVLGKIIPSPQASQSADLCDIYSGFGPEFCQYADDSFQ